MQLVAAICFAFLCYTSAQSFWEKPSIPSVKGVFDKISNVTTGITGGLFGGGLGGGSGGGLSGGSSRTQTTTPAGPTTTLKPLVVDDEGKSKCLRKDYEKEVGSIFLPVEEEQWVDFNTTIWDKYEVILQVNATLSDYKLLKQFYVLCAPYVSSWESDKRLGAGALASLAG